MGREDGIPDGHKVEICNRHIAQNMGSKKISKLPNFVKYGYNKIQRIFPHCPEILRLATGSNAPTGPASSAVVAANPESVPEAAPVNLAPSRFEQPATVTPSYYGRAGSHDDMDYSDNDSSDSSNDFTPSPTWWIQPSVHFGLMDPIKAMTNSLTTAYNSRLAMKVTEWADKFARNLFPDTQPEGSQKTTFEKETTFNKEAEESTERELNKAQDSIEDTASCSCAGNKPDLLITVDAYNQKDTSNSESGSSGTPAHVNDVNPSKPPEKVLRGGNIDVKDQTAAPLKLPEKPAAEQNPPKGPGSGSGSEVPPGSTQPLGDVSVANSLRADTPATPPSTPAPPAAVTLPTAGSQDSKPESPASAEASTKQDQGQNPAGTSLQTAQFPPGLDPNDKLMRPGEQKQLAGSAEDASGGKEEPQPPPPNENMDKAAGQVGASGHSKTTGSQRTDLPKAPLVDLPDNPMVPSTTSNAPPLLIVGNNQSAPPTEHTVAGRENASVNNCGTGTQLRVFSKAAGFETETGKGQSGDNANPTNWFDEWGELALLLGGSAGIIIGTFLLQKPEETQSQPAQPSAGNSQGYARVNDPNCTAFF